MRTRTQSSFALDRPDPFQWLGIHPKLRTPLLIELVGLPQDVGKPTEVDGVMDRHLGRKDRATRSLAHDLLEDVTALAIVVLLACVAHFWVMLRFMGNDSLMFDGAGLCYGSLSSYGTVKLPWPTHALCDILGVTGSFYVFWRGLRTWLTASLCDRQMPGSFVSSGALVLPGSLVCFGALSKLGSLFE